MIFSGRPRSSTTAPSTPATDVQVLVTGATGNLGPFVIQALRHDGHQVRALVRESSDRSWLNANRVEAVEGDILQPHTLGAAVDGMAAVIHLAGLHDSWAPRAQDFFELNVDGACNVRDAAREAGAHRLIFVSSGSTIGEEEGEVGSETTERRDYALGDYERSKVEAEAALLEGRSPLDVVVLNPGTVYGPGDASGTGQALIGALSGQLGVSVDEPVAWVYVKDIARGVALALVRGRPGERYILASHNLSRLAFLQRAVELADLEYEIKPASPLAWQAFGLIYSLPAWIKRSRPLISRAAVRIALHGSQLDGSKAERELGLTYTALDDGLNATLDWLHEAELVDLPEEDDDEPTDKGPSNGEAKRN